MQEWEISGLQSIVKTKWPTVKILVESYQVIDKKFEFNEHTSMLFERLIMNVVCKERRLTEKSVITDLLA